MTDRDIPQAVREIVEEEDVGTLSLTVLPIDPHQVKQTILHMASQ